LSLVGDPQGNATYEYTDNGEVAFEYYPNGTQVEYLYDDARRVSSITHRRVADWSVIVTYANQYDSASRLTQVTESPSGAVTTYQYDGAGRLLSESRMNERPYSGVYTYEARGLRATAMRDENGVVSHNGTYSYDDSGRLTQCVDSATGLTELYTWNPDSTLASYPGPGYTRRLEYDEERRLTRINKDFGGGNIQTAYEYAYGADGGRRWRKDYSANKWTWYPCGVAFCAGDLVEMESTLAGGAWTTTAQYLKGLSIVRRNSEFHHFNLEGTANVISSGVGSVLSHNLYDRFGTIRYSQGPASTPWRADWAAEESLNFRTGTAYLPSRNTFVQFPNVFSTGRGQQEIGERDCHAEHAACLRKAAAAHTIAAGVCLAAAGTAKIVCPRLVVPKLVAACFVAYALGLAACLAKAWFSYQGALAACDRQLDACLGQQ
jgi:YD repeat-containing protein